MTVPGPARLGVVMLCHQALDRAAQSARVWAEGGAAVVIHLDARVPIRQVRKMQESLFDLPDLRFSPRRRCNWGSFGLVRATQDGAELLLEKFPDVTHIYLASGSCLPLRPVSELTDWLAANPDRDYIESVNALDAGWTVGGLDVERFTLHFPFDWRQQRWLFDAAVWLQRRFPRLRRKLPKGISPHLGSQWWCLTAKTLRAILSDPRRDEFDRYFRGCWIPDESYFQTLVRRHSRRIEGQSLTLARFDAQGKPYVLYDDHMTVLAESRFFVARKAWPLAEGLYTSFPRPASSRNAPPDPWAFGTLVDHAVRRSRTGRPGLYMQSRFPRKDAENGKTSAPYAVLQGLSDLFPDFENWLSMQVPTDVHGHLLGPDMAEFAGRPGIGPGALPVDPRLRDHDIQGFLAALVRITPRMQSFQYGPRDNQALNWFMATDPNARLFVVTGAWMVPLLTSGMPFDDVRRIAAKLHRIESAQLDILHSVWVRARLRIWDLSEFISRPAVALGQMLTKIDPGGGHDALSAGDLPPMRSLDGLPDFLHRLQNAGLHSRLTGDFRPPPLLLHQPHHTADQEHDPDV